MDKDVEAGIVGSLSQIIKNKHIYYGSKPVHWCIESSSALAEAEVEYKDITSKAVCVNFKLSEHKRGCVRRGRQRWFYIIKSISDKT